MKATIVNSRNLSPFHLACLSGDKETCELFIENGADIMAKAKTQHTPLHFAAWEGNEEICKLLIETGNRSFSLCVFRRISCCVFVFLTP